MDYLALIWIVFWIWLGWFLTSAIRSARLP